ncbi:hypothetical protein [Amycolatopsis tucumanensis]|uniref:Uncharacterized protein n=1 Tax=Amycolatopsis tucumanensis TaxID=401106 RepID=A0ABP7JA66_9PSEU|nr:hypothetical protein [Amycolatopsis tucumanensis]MCF6421637.1 hypothetical protein [Amycolatopsis tucumanensis]
MAVAPFGIDVVVVQPGIIRTCFEDGTAAQLTSWTSRAGLSTLTANWSRAKASGTSSTAGGGAFEVLALAGVHRQRVVSGFPQRRHPRHDPGRHPRHQTPLPLSRPDHR